MVDSFSCLFSMGMYRVSGEHNVFVRKNKLYRQVNGVRCLVYGSLRGVSCVVALLGLVNLRMGMYMRACLKELRVV